MQQSAVNYLTDPITINYKFYCPIRYQRTNYIISYHNIIAYHIRAYHIILYYIISDHIIRKPQAIYHGYYCRHILK